VPEEVEPGRNLAFLEAEGLRVRLRERAPGDPAVSADTSLAELATAIGGSTVFWGPVLMTDNETSMFLGLHRWFC
jgi:hypothetical protein